MIKIPAAPWGINRHNLEDHLDIPLNGSMPAEIKGIVDGRKIVGGYIEFISDQKKYCPDDRPAHTFSIVSHAKEGIPVATIMNYGQGGRIDIGWHINIGLLGQYDQSEFTLENQKKYTYTQKWRDIYDIDVPVINSKCEASPTEEYSDVDIIIVGPTIIPFLAERLKFQNMNEITKHIKHITKKS